MRTSRSALVVLSCVLLVACTPETDAPAPEAPARGGSLEIGMVGEPQTLDPYGASASELSYALVRPVFPMPYRMLTDGAVEPDLARSLEVIRGGARLTLADREWSDGRRIKPSDVVASIRRATPPSGFATIRKARVSGPNEVRLWGHVQDWQRTLATGAFVLPRGRLTGGNVSGGPFRFSAYRRGRKVVYEANREAPEPPLLDHLEVSFVQGTELLIELLEEGDVDVAWVPSTVNLGDRLDERGIPHASAMGDERIVMAYSPDRLTGPAFRSFISAIDVRALDAAFLRTDGRATRSGRDASGPVPASVSLGAPEGDELLSLLQRAVQLDLERAGTTVELITGPVSALYGAWQEEAPADILLMRTVSAPPDDSVVLASVATYMAWREGVRGIGVRASLDGPLWNAGEWWRDPSI